jgi:hypothetical protein
MAACWHLARNLAMVLALSLSSEAIAQTTSIHLQASFDLSFDCERPFYVRNSPIHAEFTAVLNANRSASADVVFTGVFTTTTVHFDARLGGVPQSAPGGTSQLHVAARNRLRGIWDLPNNQLILDIVAAGRSCSTGLNMKLKPGKREYSLFDGVSFYYCSKAQLLRTSCRAY